MEDNDVQQHLKKRARRRLVGAVFFVSLVAVLLPTLMDSEPRPPAQDIDIRIPGQDEKAFAPALIPPAEPVARQKPEPAQMAQMAAQQPAQAAQKPVEVAAAKTEVRPEPKPAPKLESKPETRPETRPEKKPPPAKEVVSKPAAPKENVAQSDEASRAAAILAGKSPDAPVKPAAAGGQHVILIGAFSNEANVTNLRKKLGEQGIKVYTEALDSPQGKKTRVRAGPFPNREAAEKALQKMQRIGVSGVVAAQP